MSRKLQVMILCLMGFVHTVSVAQNGNKASVNVGLNDEKSVQWVSTYPTPQGIKTKNKFLKKVGNAVFGIRPAVFIKPVAIYADSPKKYWVLDQKAGSVFIVEKEKSSLYKLKLEDDRPLGSLVDICRVPGTGLLFTDSRLGKIFVIRQGAKKVTPFKVSVNLEQPTGIAYLESKNEIWVLETKAHRIAVLSKDGTLIRTIGKRGIGEGEFNYPTHIWIDDKGLVYIVDSMNYRVQIFNSDGELISMFGEAGDGSGYFAMPKGIAVDSHGNIYVADALFHTVQIFDSKGNFLYNFGQQGRNDGDFWMPSGIYISKDDYIFVADSYNSRIQVFKLVNHE